MVVSSDIYALGIVGLLALVLLILLVRRRVRRGKSYIVVDGSNVMFWGNGNADLATVRAVAASLREWGFETLVWFDANAGYKVSDRYMPPRALADRIDLPQRQVFVAPKGTPADPLLLDMARKLSAPVCSNDRFRDWWEQYPEAQDPSHMVRGQAVNGGVKLEVLGG